MEDAQNRRRRPVTYGKPTRKRLSDIDEIFSSPSVMSRSPIPPSALITRKEKGGAKATAKSNNNSNSTSNKNSSDFQYKKRSAPKVLNSNSSDPAAPKPRATTDSDSPASDEDLYEIEGQSDEAAAAQLINEERLSRGDELRVFDVPSSDDDEEELSAPRPTLKRKRVPSVPPKPAPKPKGKTADKPPGDNVTVAETENMLAKSKRSRLPARTKPEEPVVGPSNKLTTAGKITKSTGRSSSMKGKEKVAGQQQPSTRRSVSVEPSGDRVTAPSRSRVTRSQSRQLSEEPPEIGTRPTIFEESRRRPLHMQKIEVVIPSSPKQARKQEVKKRPKPLAEKNLKVIPEEKPSENTATEKIAKKRVVAKTQTAVRSKVEAPVNNIQNGEPFGLFAYDLSPMVQPRKRLIDVLGAAQVGSRKKSCSPSASDVSSQEYRSRSQSKTQSQETPESYETSSQEVTIMNVQRQQFGNGRAGPRVTYARERSYRTEEPAACSLEDMLSMPLPSIKPMQPARRRLEQLKPPDDDTESVGSKKSKSMIKSIHELRAAGEHSRFIDDVEDLFLDIEGTCPLGTKRSGYFELTNRLRDKTFNQKFRTNSFDERLLTKMDLQTDEIITFVLSYLTLCFLQEDFTPRTMLRVCKHGIMPMLARMLASTRDVSVIAKDRKTNLSKAAQSQVSDLRTLVEKCPVFLGENVKVISPQILALKVLDWLVRRSREHGSADEILSRNALRGLVEILGPFSTSKEYPKSLQTHGLQLLELPISTLEAYTMGGYGSLEAQTSDDELLSLARLFTVASSWTCDVDLGPILLLLLRLNINITNNRSSACEKLSDSSLIASLVALIKKKFDALSGTLEEQERLLSVDLLVLSLGLMMNLAEFSPRARSVVGVQAVPSVEGSPLAIDILLDIFLDRLERAAEADSMEESHTNVAFGYLAVLLGDLCQEDHIRYKARGRLPNSSLKLLQGAIEEFIAHHRKVDEHMFGVEEEDDGPGPQAEFTARLQDVMVRLRAYA